MMLMHVWEANIHQRRANRRGNARAPVQKTDREREFELARQDRELKKREIEVRSTAAELRNLKNQINAGGQITLDKLELAKRAELSEVNVSRLQKQVQMLTKENEALAAAHSRMRERVQELSADKLARENAALREQLAEYKDTVGRLQQLL